MAVPEGCDDGALEALARRLGEALVDAGLLLATAESCTGGWVAKVVTDVPGSSGWFERGVITYSNAAKAELLGVPRALLEAHGAVSEPVARAMAEGALAASRAHLAVAVSGIAGPGGGTPDKPVGTVWLAWAQRDGRLRTRRERFPGDREAVRRQTVRAALEGLLDALRG